MIAQLDELIQKISDNAGKIWQRIISAKPGLRGAVEQGTDEYAMRVHHACAVSGEIMSGARHWAEDEGKDGVGKVLRHFSYALSSIYIIAPAKESRRVTIPSRRSFNPQRCLFGYRSDELRSRSRHRKCVLKRCRIATFSQSAALQDNLGIIAARMANQILCAIYTETPRDFLSEYFFKKDHRHPGVAEAPSRRPEPTEPHCARGFLLPMLVTLVGCGQIRRRAGG